MFPVFRNNQKQWSRFGYHVQTDVLRRPFLVSGCEVDTYLLWCLYYFIVNELFPPTKIPKIDYNEAWDCEKYVRKEISQNTGKECRFQTQIVMF